MYVPDQIPHSPNFAVGGLKSEYHNHLTFKQTLGMSSDISRNSAIAPVWARGPPITSNYPPAHITDNISPFLMN